MAPLPVAVAAPPVPEAVVEPDPVVVVEPPAAALHSALASVSWACVHSPEQCSDNVSSESSKPWIVDVPSSP